MEMENMNVITEEQVNTVAEEVIEAGNADLMSFVTKAGAVAGVALVGFAAYKYGIKPLLAKRKAKKEAAAEDDIVEEYDPADVSEEESK